MRSCWHRCGCSDDASLTRNSVHFNQMKWQTHTHTYEPARIHTNAIACVHIKLIACNFINNTLPFERCYLGNASTTRIQTYFSHLNESAVESKTRMEKMEHVQQWQKQRRKIVFVEHLNASYSLNIICTENLLPFSICWRTCWKFNRHKARTWLVHCSPRERWRENVPFSCE